EAIGTVDELNSFIGLARVEALHFEAILKLIQDALFELGSVLADPTAANTFDGIDLATRLEASMDEMTSELAPLKNFILPGGSRASAVLHLARSVCRRAERCVISLELSYNEPVVFLNRLSDWLFVVARYSNLKAGTEDILWKQQ
ncbi:MAG: cob(I)yrinic acid a,c-diamide adenosyltransferase, partial [Fimbriimonadaceae bacterium]